MLRVMASYLLAVGQVLGNRSIQQLRDVLLLCHICQGVLYDMGLQHCFSLTLFQYPVQPHQSHMKGFSSDRADASEFHQAEYRDKSRIYKTGAWAGESSFNADLLRAVWMASLCSDMALCKSSCASSSGDFCAATMILQEDLSFEAYLPSTSGNSYDAK